MIISTKCASALIRRTVGQGKNSIISIDAMIDQFAVDPTMSSPKKDLFIVCDEDLINKRTAAKFQQAIATKHPDVKILFINKKAKMMFENGLEGIDIMLKTPKPDEIATAISKLAVGALDEKVAKKLGAAQAEKIPKQEKVDKRNSGGAFKNKRQQELAERKRRAEQAQVMFNPAGHVITELENQLRYATDADGNRYLIDMAGNAAPLDNFGNPIYVDEMGAPLPLELTPLVTRIEYAEELLKTNPDKVRELAQANPEYAQALRQMQEELKTVDEVPINDGFNPEVQQSGDVLNVEPTDYQDRPGPVENISMDTESNILHRIEETNDVADITVLMKEMKATALVKDLFQTNATYSGIEEKLKSLRDAIYTIMHDRSISSLDDKLTKVYALTHDKAFYSAKGDTLIEQRLEEIVNVIVNQTKATLASELDEIRTAISRSVKAYSVQDVPARLSGLAEERADLIVQLRRLQQRINSIYTDTDSLIMGTAEYIGKNAIQLSGDEDIDTHIRARGNVIVADETRTAMTSAIELSQDKLPDTFAEMEMDIKSLLNTINRLIEVDDEVAQARDTLIDRLQKKNVEDSVIALTTLKQSLRVFVANENTGRTIVPYLLSKYTSRSKNTLLVDLTTTGKYEQYDIATKDYDDFITNMYLEEFLVVKGELSDSPVAAQQLVTNLLKAVDYYKVINVVLRPDQVSLFNVIAEDVLSVNYITDTVPSHLDNMRSFIESIKLDNVGQRVFINKCDIPLKPVLKRLGLEDSLDYQICIVPNVAQITAASLDGYDPTPISAVKYAFEEIMRHVKP